MTTPTLLGLGRVNPPLSYPFLDRLLRSMSSYCRSFILSESSLKLPDFAYTFPVCTLGLENGLIPFSVLRREFMELKEAGWLGERAREDYWEVESSLIALRAGGEML
jgi:hypothetical protein